MTANAIARGSDELIMDARALRPSTTTTHGPWRTRAAIPVAVALAAALISATVTAAGGAAQRDLDRTAATITASFDARVDDAVAVVTTARGLFRIDPQPAPQDFAVFVAAATNTATVADGRLPDVAFARRARGSGRYVVTLATDASEALLDVDVGASTVHRTAMHAARDTGVPAVTSWVARLSDPGADPAHVDRVATVYLPVYRTDRVPATVAARRDALTGWTSTRLDADALFSDADIGPDDGYDVTLYAGRPSARTLVHTSRDTPESAGPRLTATRSLAVDEREWTIVVARPDPATVVLTPLRGLLLVVAIFGAALVAVHVAAHRRGRPTDQPSQDGGAERSGSQPPTAQVPLVALPATTEGANAPVTPGVHAADDYAARVSQELRTPLNGVLGLAALMLYDELSTVQRQRLLTLRDAGQHLLAILDHLRDVGARASEPADPGVTPFRMSAVVDQVVAAYVRAAEDKGLRLRSEVDPRLGLLVGDASQLRRMLQHLIDNAVAFTERGGVDVHAELVDRTDDRCTVRIAVRDTGIGLDPDIQHRLLAPREADEPRMWKPGSHGLGLAICRQIVDGLGGTLEVDATRGRGSAISCTVGLGVAGLGVELEPGRVDAPQPAPRVSSERSHATVLLVEDDDINQVVAQGMLEQLGYTVDVAADGIEAVEALRRRSYDVVLMDCGMPRLDGYSTTEHVRATEGTGRHTPIIAMTAAALASDRQRCLDAGMDDYLSKPVTIDALAAALQRAGVAPSTARAPTALVDVQADRGGA